MTWAHVLLATLLWSGTVTLAVLVTYGASKRDR